MHVVDECLMSLEPLEDGYLCENTELTRYERLGLCCVLIAVSSLLNGILVENTGVM